MRITLKQLEVFIAVAQEGNVTRAASQLNITQSATSMALADFETQLHRKLFDRVGRRLQLNEAGRLLLPKAIDTVARATEIETLASSSGSLSGSLRVGASLTIGNYLMPGIVGSFMRQHPGVQMQIKMGNTRQIVQELQQFHVDLGFIEGFCHEPDIEVLPWSEDELVVFAAADHPLARQGAVSEADLAAASWILREAGSGTREVFDNAVLGRISSINLLMELAHTEATLRAVETGIGISCASRLTLTDALARGSLAIVPTPFLDLRREFFMLVHRQKYRTRGLEEFLAWCRTAGQRGGIPGPLPAG